MASALPNLTLYALLTAFEEDMRNLVLQQLGRSGLSPEEILGAAEHETALRRAQADLDGPVSQEGISELLPYLDFNSVWMALNRHRSEMPEDISRSLKNLASQFGPLPSIRNRVAHSRPLEYSDLPRVTAAINQALQDAPEIWPELVRTTERLASDPSFLLAIEPPAHDDRISNNLPDPDFDETGFLGRSALIEKVRSLCLLGGHPVITIYGDGGVGKTSLALKIAYELLDDPQSRFDSIVWTTSKTTTLTGNDVVRIEGAISNSLGVMSDIAETLAGRAPSDPVAEVVEYLREFRILLIIDNLETVLDQRLRDFLAAIPAGGSKILLTSRIGVGAYEHPVELEPMTDDEAVRLLRALADVRGVPDIVEMNNKRLSRYCRRMKNNPLWIKWFVTGVQAGGRPEDLLSNPDHFLDFALTNVYDYLSEESHDLLRVMQTVPGSHSQAQLVFLTEMSTEQVQRALVQLARTHMMRIRRSSGGSTFETQYTLGELTRAYLSKHHPVGKEDHARYKTRHNKLISDGEDLRAKRKRDPFLYRSLDMGSSGNLIVARQLLAALTDMRREDFEGADAAIDRAKQLAPDWYEVHRVAGNVSARRGNYAAAQDHFEAAVELAPESITLRYWFGLFLMMELKDHAAAARQFEQGGGIDRPGLILRLELARARLYMEEFAGAREELDIVLEHASRLTLEAMKKLYDLDIQYFRRLSERLALDGKHREALEMMRQMRVALGDCPQTCVDERILSRVQQCMPTIARIERVSADAETLADAKKMRQWVERSPKRPSAQSAESGKVSGVVKDVVLEKEFGFIEIPDRPDVFFHVSNAPGVSSLRELPTGTLVEFAIAKANGKTRAVEVVAA